MGEGYEQVAPLVLHDKTQVDIVLGVSLERRPPIIERLDVATPARVAFVQQRARFSCVALRGKGAQDNPAWKGWGFYRRFSGKGSS